MDYLPHNPDILVSSINMLLRDEEFDSLESLCVYLYLLGHLCFLVLLGNRRGVSPARTCPQRMVSDEKIVP